jgi:Subtilase family
MAQCPVLITEGKDGVPLRFPRPVMALIAAGTAAASIGLAIVPAGADQVRHREWWQTSLGFMGAWAASQGSGVTVAVLSDGVNASQPDLAGAVTAAPAPQGAPIASGRYLGEQGTEIASLIAGRGHGPHGGAGLIGAAPEAKILSVPVTLPADDPALSQSANAARIPAAIAAGIRYAVQNGARVIDLPIDPGQPGSSGTGGAAAAAGGSTAEQKAINYAIKHDVVLVAPAGDDGTASDAPNYPAAYHGVIAVGAFDSAFVKPPWSSHDSYVTVTAAGVGMLTATNNGGYQTVNSTSAASAVVSGIAALIRSRYPGLTAEQVRTALTSSTVYRPKDGAAHGSGFGSVNAAKAMAAAAVLSTPPAARAGADAQPPVAPAAVAAASGTQGLGPQLLRAGEISGGLLALLLLLISVYAATGRRRRRGSEPPVTAQWAHRQAQSRYPQAGDFGQAGDFADADRMLEVFTTPVARPDRGSIGQPVIRALGSRADEGLFAPAAPPAARAPRTESAAPGDASADSGPWPSHGPASRAVGRRPTVSGTPPWEPAAAPDTELPWAAAPGRHSISSRPAAAALPGPPSAEPPAWRDEPAGQPLFEAADRDGPAHAAELSPSVPTAWNPIPDGAGAVSGRHAQSAAGWESGWGASAADPAVGAGSDLWSGGSDRNGGHDWSGSQPSADSGVQSGSRGEDEWPGEPRTAASGLPIRRPRPMMPAPLSPSGSLWEPTSRESAPPEPGDGQYYDQDPGQYSGQYDSYSQDPGQYDSYGQDPGQYDSYGQDPGQYDSYGQDPGGRPIYVWNPPARPSSAPRYPRPPSE